MLSENAGNPLVMGWNLEDGREVSWDQAFIGKYDGRRKTWSADAPTQPI
jgi:hypothetical protein